MMLTIFDILLHLIGSWIFHSGLHRPHSIPEIGTIDRRRNNSQIHRCGILDISRATTTKTITINPFCSKPWRLPGRKAGPWTARFRIIQLTSHGDSWHSVAADTVWSYLSSYNSVNADQFLLCCPATTHHHEIREIFVLRTSCIHLASKNISPPAHAGPTTIPVNC